MPPPKLPVVIHAFVDARRRHRRLRRVIGMPPRRARMRVGEVVGVVKSVPPRGEEVIGVVRSRQIGEEVVGVVRLRQIGAAALGEVVVVVKSRQEFKSALARAMNEGIERPLPTEPACEVVPH
jgi:hypothetical protein